jgi:hypothetical protein
MGFDDVHIGYTLMVTSGPWIGISGVVVTKGLVNGFKVAVIRAEMEGQGIKDVALLPSDLSLVSDIPIA